MILYSVTTSIDSVREAEWAAWMRATHLPAVMATGCFAHYRFCRLLHQDDEAGGTTYNVQYLLADVAAYEHYKADFAPALQAETRAKFGDSALAFRTLLEVIEQSA
jgi:hypothetical protein